MAQSSRSRRTSALAGGLVLLLGVGLTSALATSASSAPASSQPASRAGHRATTSLQGFRTAPAMVQVRSAVSDQVSVRPRAHRVVRIQARRPGSTVFHTVSSGFSSRTGSFRAVYRPTTVGTWRFRLFLPATATATRIVSPSRAITAAAISSTATTAALSLNGSAGTTAKQTVNVSEAFDITGTHAGQGLSLVSGTLDYGDGTPPEAFDGDPAGWAPAPHQYAAPGPVTATWTVVDSAGASVTTSVDVTVYAEPTAAISPDPGSELQPGKPVEFTVTSATPAGTGFLDFDTYSLSGTAFENAVHGNGPPPATFSITFDHSGTYTVFVTGDNDAGGLAEASVDVVIVDPPKV